MAPTVLLWCVCTMILLLLLVIVVYVFRRAVIQQRGVKRLSTCNHRANLLLASARCYSTCKGMRDAILDSERTGRALDEAQPYGMHTPKKKTSSSGVLVAEDVISKMFDAYRRVTAEQSKVVCSQSGDDAQKR